MRTIKFRGKRLDNGEWVYGDFLHGRGNIAWIVIDAEKTLYESGSPDAILAPNKEQNLYRIDPDTIGQYTGLKVKGQNVYEGDIIAAWWFEGNPPEEFSMYVVRYFDKDENGYSEVGSSVNYPINAPAVGLGLELVKGTFDHKDLKLCYFADRFKIIGNIYENPELFEGQLEKSE